MRSYRLVLGALCYAMAWNNLALADTPTEAAEAEVKRLKAEVDELVKVIREKNAQLAEAERRAATERNRAVTAQIEAATLRKRLEGVNAQVEELTRELARARAGGADRPPRRPAPNPPKGDVEGLVKSIDAASDLFVLNIGADAGLEKGHTLEVFRTDPPKYLGTIRIVEVNPKQAIAQAVGKLHDAVRIGDQVATRIK